MWRLRIQSVTSILIIALSVGCSSSSNPSEQTQTKNGATQTVEEVAPAESSDATLKPAKKRRTIAPVEIGASPSTEATSTQSSAERLTSIREALRPFQILLGNWNGLSKKAATDHPSWAYDWVSDPKSPGLRVVSDNGVYVRDGRLSYLPESDQFEFKATDAEGANRTFRGTFIEPIRDVAGDEKKLQRTYKLQLTESEPNSSGEQWRVTFNQQENNRYILEVDRKRGNSPFTRVDTIHTQREGTSFALSESDYGEKTCIISQGLGTISVSYKGQSFWVCCSGCKAAFEDDPEKWIAKWTEKKKSSGK